MACLEVDRGLTQTYPVYTPTLYFYNINLIFILHVVVKKRISSIITIVDLSPFVVSKLVQK